MDAAAELRRLQYLSSMGVQPFVSKRNLPGAAPSLRMALRAGTQITSIKGDEQGAATAIQTEPKIAVPSSLRQTLAQPRDAQSRTRESSRPEQVKTEASAAPRQQTEPQERFSLVTIVVGGRLWVEEIADGLLAQEQLALVVAIDRALRHPDTKSAAPAHTVFTWPIHGNSQLDLSKEEASASLEGYLRRQLDDNACVELICLGAACAERLHKLRLPVAQRTLLSTRELLEQPLKKRDLWMQLRSQ